MHYPSLFSLRLSVEKKIATGCIAQRQDVRKDSSQSYYANRFSALLRALSGEEKNNR